MTRPEKAFLARRRRLLRFWPYAGAFAGLAWLGLVAWLGLFVPLLVSPFEVQQRLQADKLAEDSAALMAVMLPVIIDLCLLLTLVVIAFSAVALNTERKYLDILRAAGYDETDDNNP